MKLPGFFQKKKKAEEKKVKEPEKVAPPKPKEKRADLAWRILKSPHISEKATGLVGKNQYTFNVSPQSNKNEIKKAIEGLYGVDVLDVKIIRVPRKRRRIGRILGWRKGYKKAIVKLKSGQKIEVLPR